MFSSESCIFISEVASSSAKLYLHQGSRIFIRDTRLVPGVFCSLIVAMSNNIAKNSLALLFIALVGGTVVFVALGLASYYYYSTSQPTADTQQPGSFMRTEAEFRDKLTELNIDKNKVVSSLKSLKNIKQETVIQLRQMGIKSGADYLKTEDQAAKRKVLDLQRTIKKIKIAEANIETYEGAVGRIRSMLAKFELERVSEKAALSEAQAIELQEIILDLDNKLEVKTDIFEDEELKNLLDLEMVD